MPKKILITLLAVVLALAPICALAAQFSTDPDAIELAAKSILMLEVYDADNELLATGSGFVAFNNRTLITNYHVIEGADWMLANSDDGYEYMVTKVLIADEDKDIAICEFMSPTDLTPLTLNIDGDLKRAQNVVAIGNPMGTVVGATNTVSIGNISALYQDESVRWIQFTAPISEGSSGGALFDDQGQVIGMTSAYVIDAQNMNLAIHISEVADLFAQAPERAVSFAEYLSGTDAQVAATPEPKDAIVSYRPLKTGDQGEAVRRLQNALAELGYFTGSIDGIFGKQTEAAVRQFNTDNNISDADIASARTQLILYRGNPLPYGDAEMALYFADEAYAAWEFLDNGNCSIHFEVTNGGQKTVQSYELYVYAEDARGNDLYDNTVYYETTQTRLAPGETAYSDYITIPDGDRIAAVYCGIHQVTYTDGTTCTLPDDEVTYDSWVVGSADSQ